MHDSLFFLTWALCPTLQALGLPLPPPSATFAVVTTALSLQIHRLAAQCIRKNLAVFLAIKDWPWWQLLASLRPLLSATIGDEQLHAKEVGARGWQGSKQPFPHKPRICMLDPDLCNTSDSPDASMFFVHEPSLPTSLCSPPHRPTCSPTWLFCRLQRCYIYIDPCHAHPLASPKDSIVGSWVLRLMPVMVSSTLLVLTFSR